MVQGSTVWLVWGTYRTRGDTVAQWLKHLTVVPGSNPTCISLPLLPLGDHHFTERAWKINTFAFFWTLRWIYNQWFWSLVILGNVFILCINVSHYSLKQCGVMSTGTIALARALEVNKSLEELMYVTEGYSKYCRVKLPCLTCFCYCVLWPHMLQNGTIYPTLCNCCERQKPIFVEEFNLISHSSLFPWPCKVGKVA